MLYPKVGCCVKYGEIADGAKVAPGAPPAVDAVKAVEVEEEEGVKALEMAARED